MSSSPLHIPFNHPWNMRKGHSKAPRIFLEVYPLIPIQVKYLLCLQFRMVTILA